jgi:hypothetical protein
MDENDKRGEEKMKYKMLKDKRGWLLRDFVIVGIIFGLVIALYIVMVASVANNYGNQEIISASFAQHYSKLSTNLNQLDTGYSTVKGSGGLNLIGTFNVAFNSVFTVVAMVWDGVAIYTGMATNVSGDFSFLDQTVTLLFLTSLIAMITAYLIFVWLSSVSRGKI